MSNGAPSPTKRPRSSIRRYWAQTLFVLQKELVDALRDRRSLLSALVFPLAGPLLIGLMFTLLADKVEDAETTSVPVVGAEYAPELIRWMEDQGVEMVDPPADPFGAVERSEVEFVLVIPEDFAADFLRSKPVKLELVVDGSRTDAGFSARHVRSLVEQYSAEIGTLRLIAHGLSPEIARPLVVRKVEVATAQQLSANLLNFVPLFVILSAFVGGMYVAADATAGERERGSLETLMLNPVPRVVLVLGKWFASACFSIVSVVLTLSLLLVVMNVAPLHEFGFDLNVRFLTALGMIMVSIPLAFMATGAQLLLASFARSFKEAQSYLSMLMLIPMVPGFVGSFHPLGTDTWMLAVPALAQHIVLTDLLGGEPLTVGSAVLVTVLPLLTGLACVLATARLLRREKVVFGR